jgi:hypothetical protein
MPGRDRTGPMGEGPRSGRGLGDCGERDDGGGFRRGGGRGRGWSHGGGRFRGSGRGRGLGTGRGSRATATDTEILENRIRDLEERLAELGNRD